MIMRQCSKELEKNLEENNNSYECYVANDNSQLQVVVSGLKKDIELLSNDLSKKKIKNIKLNVSAPFHCKFMKPASEKMKNSGNSGSFIFANGIGLGYSTKFANVNFNDISYKFKSSSLDLSYTIGSSFSFTLGAGRIINGRGKIILDKVDYSTASVSGESIFFNLGIPFFGGEILFGYHHDQSKFRNFQCQMSGESVILSVPVNLVSDQIISGIGFFF